MADRFFRIKLEDDYSDLNPISAGIPQGNILGPILYLIYTSFLQQSISSMNGQINGESN